MVQKIKVVLVDDLDGGDADQTVQFGLDGVSYEIDLSDGNARRLRDALAGYVGEARRVGARSGRGRRGGGHGAGSEAGEIRAWARANGYTVSDRGRIPAEVVAAYRSAS